MEKEVFSNEVYLDWIYWLLRTRHYQRSIINSSSGTTVRHTSPTKICEYEFSYPEKQYQHKIVHILTSLDSKIDLLSRQNQTLESIAQTLFKRWFVDFEFPCLPQSYRPSGQVNLSEMAQVCTYKRVGGVPEPDGDSWFVYVLLCEDGSFYKGMTNDLYLRFYDHYTGQGAKHTKTHKPVKIIHWEKFETKGEARKREEELKTGHGRTWVQRQWYKFCLPSAQTSSGLPAHESKRMKAGLPAPECQLRMAGKMVASELGEIPDGWRVGTLGEIVEFRYGKALKEEERINGNYPVIGSNGIVGYHDAYFVKGPGIVTGRKGTIGKLIWVSDNFTPIDTTFYIKDKLNLNNLFYHYFLLKYQDLNRITSDSAVPRLNRNLAHANEISIPSKSTIALFNNICLPTFEKLQSNTKQIQTLTKTRDTLLPKLMSGQIRVN